jgi:hypothetical protein
LKIGMGGLGWTFETTMATPIWAVELAQDGKVDLLQTIHGKGDSGVSTSAGPQPENLRPATSENLRSMFRGFGAKTISRADMRLN